jgi:sugar fermentation stimulation protein A
LIPGCTVYLSVSDNSARKTKYDLITTEKHIGEGRAILINMDSQVPNDVAEEWLKEGEIFSSNAVIRREVKMGNSRFDFYIEDGERKAFLEVKGCTLEKDGVAMFPDAPTERGVKHIKELIECVKNGYEAYVMFVIQMKGVYEFRPNDDTHKEFGDALREAEQNGVHIIAMDCIVTPDSLKIDKPKKLNLK